MKVLLTGSTGQLGKTLIVVKPNNVDGPTPKPKKKPSYTTEATKTESVKTLLPTSV